MSIENKELSGIKHILGIDFGTSNIGLALADTETRMAFALTVLKNDNNIFDNLKEIIIKENIQRVVVGKPGYSQVNDVDDKDIFGDKLKKKFGVEIIFAEEMFTTKSAHLNLHEARKKNVGKNDDAESARIILQDWLDKNNINIYNTEN